MHHATLIDEAVSLLEQLTEAEFCSQHMSALAALPPAQRDPVVAALRSLPAQVTALTSDADLLALANGIIALVEATPPLRAMLLPSEKPGATPAAVQRDVTLAALQADDDAAAARTYLAAHQPGLYNLTTQLQQELDQAIPPVPPAEALPEPALSGQPRRAWWQQMVARIKR